MHDIDPNNVLKTGVVQVSHPYLETDDPDYILVTNIAFNDKMEQDKYYSKSNDDEEELPWTRTVTHHTRSIKSTGTKTPPPPNNPPENIYTSTWTSTPNRTESKPTIIQEPYYSPLPTDRDDTLMEHASPKMSSLR